MAMASAESVPARGESHMSPSLAASLESGLMTTLFVPL